MALYSTQDIVDAYNREVVGGGMSEADFVSRAMSPVFGVSADQLSAARDVLLGGSAARATTAFDSGISAADRAAAEAAMFGSGTSNVGPLTQVATTQTTAGPLTSLATPVGADKTESRTDRDSVRRPDDTGYLPPEQRAAWLATLSPTARDAFLAAHPGYIGTSTAATEINSVGAATTLTGLPKTLDPTTNSGVYGIYTGGTESQDGTLTGYKYELPQLVNGAGITAEADTSGNVTGYQGVRQVNMGGHDGYATDYYDSKGTLIKSVVDLDIGNKDTHLVRTFDPKGTILDQSMYQDTGAADLRNLALMVVSFAVPGSQVFIQGLNAVRALENGDALGFVLNATGVAGNLGVNIPSEFTDITRYVKAADDISKGNYLNAAASLTDSPDLKTAAAAANLLKAVESGNLSAIAGATQNLTRIVDAATTNATSKLTSLTGSGRTGDDMGGVYDTVTGGAGNDLGATAFVNAVTKGGAKADDAFAASKYITGADSLTGGGGRDTTTAAGGSGVDTGRGLEITNAQADTPAEARALALAQGASTYTYGGKTYTIEATNADVTRQLNANDAAYAIAGAKTFSDAFAIARANLGPGQTFTWNGKDYSTATFAERSDLSGTNVVPGTTSTDPRSTRYTGYSATDAAAMYNTQQQLAAESANQTVQNTGLWNRLTTFLTDQMQMSTTAAQDFLRNNPNSPLTNSVSTAMEAAGELMRNVGGGTALLLDNKPISNALVRGGTELQQFGQSIGTGPQDTKNWNTTMALVSGADGFDKLGVIAGRILDGTSGLARQVEIELRQELPALFLGGGTAKGVLVASGLVDTADTAGNAALDAYDDAVKAGKNHQAALSDARIAGAAAGATEAAVQLTLGKLADLAVGKLDNVITKGAGRVLGEGVTEGGQEGGASAAVDIALGRDVDVNKAITQGVLGTAVGKGTATTTSGVNAAQDAAEITATNIANTGSTTKAVDTTISSAAGTGNANVANTVSGTVSGAINTGADPGTVVADSVVAGTNAGGNVSSVTNAAVGAAVQNGADVNTVINAATTAATNTGLDTTTAVATAANAAVNNGANVTVVNNAATNAATNNNANVNVNTKTDANTNTTATTATNANTNTNTTVTTDNNTNTNTTVTTNANTNTANTVTVNNNSNTTVNTDTNNNTNTSTTTVTNGNTNNTATITTNSNTGEVKITDATSTDTNVIDSVTIDLGGGVVIDLTTGETLSPEEVERRKTESKKSTPKLPKLPPKKPVAGAPPASPETAPKYPYKPTSPEETWLGGRFLQTLPLAALYGLLPEDTPMGQEVQAISALRRAAGLDQDTKGERERPDYYSYGKEPDAGAVLRPYMNGGTVQGYESGGKIMTSPLMAAQGGDVPHKGSHYVQGAGGGQDDLIPAKLADGEYVFDAEIVAALGDGSNKEGAKRLDAMREAIRKHKRSGSLKSIPPKAKSPLQYLKEATK